MKLIFQCISVSLLILFVSCGTEDLCDSITCNNDGVCVEGICDCPEGFSGPQCNTEDLCVTQSIDCLNGGTCLEGICDCPDGYTGVNCELIDVNNLQMILDNDILTPLGLVEQGVSLASLYGLNYAGGIIFYIDVDDRLPDADGMVVSEVNLSTKGECKNEDLSEIANAGYSNANPGEFSSSGLLGQGKSNTDAILANCEDLIDGAAKLCRDKGPEWFLPSMEEIWLVDQNLPYELALFTDFDYYWTSSENSATFFWAINAGNRFDALGSSSSFVLARAVREF